MYIFLPEDVFVCTLPNVPCVCVFIRSGDVRVCFFVVAPAVVVVFVAVIYRVKIFLEKNW